MKTNNLDYVSTVSVQCLFDELMKEREGRVRKRKDVLKAGKRNRHYIWSIQLWVTTGISFRKTAQLNTKEEVKHQLGSLGM